MIASSSGWARLALPLVVTLGVSGCEGFGIGAGDSANVSLSMAVPRAGVAASSASLLAVPITGGGHTLDLQSVSVTFSEMVLERAEGGLGGDSDGDSDTDSDSDGAANERFRAGATTIDLPLDGGVVTPISQSLPVGAYEELELDVAFVRLRGTYDGQSFDVTVPVDAELEMSFDPPFEVSSEADRLNITLTIDAPSWFRNADGTLLDPRTLAGSSSAREALVRRIESSFDAFEDSDRDADDADSDSDSDGDD